MSWSLVGDIGGTNCRFGVWTAGGLGRIVKVPTSSDLVDRLEEFVTQEGSPPDKIALSAAGPVREDILRLTNADVEISFVELRKRYPNASIDILNDFESAAWAAGFASNQDVHFLQGSDLGNGPRLIVGIGTGFGAGVWTGQHAIKTEGGHVISYPLDEGEVQMFDALKHHWPETFTGQARGVEVEALVSGTGLPLVYRSYCDVMGIEPEFQTAAEVLSGASDGRDAAVAAAQSFSKHLGRSLGDLFVASWAINGIILTGGVLCKNRWLLNDNFWGMFHAGGRYETDRKSVPVVLWDSDDIGLIGCGKFIDS